MYIKYFYLKKNNEMFNQRLLQCKILNYFKYFYFIASSDNAFKILVTINLAHTVS